MNDLKIIITAGKTITVKHNDKALEFRFSLWGNMNPGVTGTIFGALNGYLNTLPDNVKQSLFDCFKVSHDVLEQETNQEVLLTLLNKQAGNIYKLTSFESLRNYLLENNLVKPCLQTSQVLTGSNPRETTYLRDEILELTMYAIYVRILAPISGTLTRTIASVSSNLFKEMEALKIITDSGFDTEQPYKRLQLYCSSYAGRRKTTTSTAVKFKMPVEDLEIYILGLFVLRRLMPYELDKSDNIIKYAFKFIEGKVAKMRQGYTDKMGNVSKSGNSEESLIDHFRISEAVPSSVRSSTNAYLKQIPLIVKHLPVKISVNKVKETLASITLKELEINDLCLPIVALCLNSVVHRWVIHSVDRQASLTAIAISAEMLKELGHDDIALWLTSSSHLKDTTAISLGSSGKVLSALKSELSEQLVARYPELPETEYVGKIRTPAHFLIEEIVKMINSVDWNGNVFEEFVDIRNSIARLFITPPYKLTQE